MNSQEEDEVWQVIIGARVEVSRTLTDISVLVPLPRCANSDCALSLSGISPCYVLINLFVLSHVPCLIYRWLQNSKNTWSWKPLGWLHLVFQRWRQKLRTKLVGSECTAKGPFEFSSGCKMRDLDSSKAHVAVPLWESSPFPLARESVSRKQCSYCPLE